MRKYGIMALLFVLLSGLGGEFSSMAFAEEAQSGSSGQAGQGQLTDQADSEVKNAIVLSVNGSKAYINGQQKSIDPSQPAVTPFIEEGTTFIPLKFISEQLGGTMSWDPKTKEISIVINGNKARIKLGETKLTVNDRVISMSAPGKTANGTTYMPLRNVVEDIFQKNLFYKDGIIIISQEKNTYSDSTLAELKRTLNPYVVYSAGLNLFHIYADGTTENKKIKFNDAVQPFIMNVSEGHFYIEDSTYNLTKRFYHKVDLQGNVISTFESKWSDALSFVFSKGGIQYYNSNKYQLYTVNDDAPSQPQFLGKGYLAEGNVYMEGTTLWFTSHVDGDYRIYKLKDGKKTPLSKKDSYLKYVNDNWIYYGYYENKRWTLYRMTKDGGQDTKLTGDADVGHSVIYNQKIYYLDNQAKELREMNLDGSNKRVICKLSKLGISIMQFDGRDIYIVENNQDGHWLDATQTLYKVSLSNGTKQKLVELPLEFDNGWVRIKNVYSLGGVVYYSLGNKIYAINAVGSKPKEFDVLDAYYFSRVYSLKVE